jgi:hypothetical protein
LAKRPAGAFVKFRRERRQLLFPSSIKFDKDKRKFYLATDRTFALWWFICLTMRKEIIDNIRRTGIYNEVQIKKLNLRYSHWCKTAARYGRRAQIFRGVSFLVTILLLSAFMFGPAVVLLLFSLDLDIIAMLVASELIGMMAVLYYLSRLIAKQKRGPGLAFVLATRVAIIAVAVLLVWIFATIGTRVKFEVADMVIEWHSSMGIVVTLSAGLITFLCLIVVVYFNSWFLNKMRRAASRNIKEELAFGDAIFFLAVVTEWSKGTLRPLPNGLEQLGDRIEQLAHVVAVKDGISREIIANRFKGSGESVREKILWVMLPKHDSPRQLMDFLVQLTTTLITLTYDDLPLSTRANSTKSNRVLNIMHVLRSLTIAAIPIGILWVSHLIGVSFPSPIDATATFIAVLWAIVSLLILIDPAIRDRVDLVKNISSIFPASKSDK